MKTVIVQFGQWESEVPVVDEVYDAIFHEGYMKGKADAEEQIRKTEDDLK